MNSIGCICSFRHFEDLRMENSKTLKISRKKTDSSVFHLYLDRPSHCNALSLDFFTEFPEAIFSLDQNPECRAIVLSAAGDHFCCGIDVNHLFTMARSLSDDPGRRGETLRREIKAMQYSITAIECCRKPVIASIHGDCIGGGIDLITACDIRYCTDNASFSVSEVDLAITADLGTLQRLPNIVGYGNAMELSLTGRTFSGLEAKSLGLVSETFRSKMKLDEGVDIVAEGIASKSPLAVSGTKEILLKSRQMTVDEGLDYVATWNASMASSVDITETVNARIRNWKPTFLNL